MNPRSITQADFDYFGEWNPRPVMYDADNDSVDPVAALVTDDETGGFKRVIRVPWILNEIDLANLAKGGTLWLNCMDGLPAHYLHVQPPHDDRGEAA
jgi:hypothetical protein